MTVTLFAYASSFPLFFEFLYYLFTCLYTHMWKPEVDIKIKLRCSCLHRKRLMNWIIAPTAQLLLRSVEGIWKGKLPTWQQVTRSRAYSLSILRKRADLEGRASSTKGQKHFSITDSLLKLSMRLLVAKSFGEAWAYSKAETKSVSSQVEEHGQKGPETWTISSSKWEPTFKHDKWEPRGMVRIWGYSMA